MKTVHFPDSTSGQQHTLGYDDAAFLAFCREIYNRNNPGQIDLSPQETIPKIIHQVWLGGSFPRCQEAYTASWKARHADRNWSYVLWVDDTRNHVRSDALARNYGELKSFLDKPVDGSIHSIVADIRGFRLHNQGLFDSTPNPGVRSDILRWEVVNWFGGFYVDTDFECLRPFDRFHYGYHFYTALQPLDTRYVQLGAAMFGSMPQHPVLTHCIESIENDWHHRGAPKKTGPIHFSKSFMTHAARDGCKDIVFPAHYFYPLGCTQFLLRKRKWKRQGSYAVHHWAKSWMPGNCRPRRFRAIKNEESTKSWND